MSVDRIIRDLTAESDVPFRGVVYDEIGRELLDLGVNLAFFVFTTAEHSSYARTLDGTTVVCPVLALYLKYNADFRQTGIDSHGGNWGDGWGQTRAVRDALNAVLRRHDYGEDYVSEHTYVFVQTLEEFVFRDIGRQCKAAVAKLVCREAPGVAVSRVFWNGYRYDVIMQNEADFRRAKRDAKAKLTATLPTILAAADKHGHCRDYEATVEFGHTGMNLFHLVREDL